MRAHRHAGGGERLMRLRDGGLPEMEDRRGEHRGGVTFRNARHQIVYAALGDRMREEIHALSMKTLTPEEFQG